MDNQNAFQQWPYWASWQPGFQAQQPPYGPWAHQGPCGCQPSAGPPSQPDEQAKAGDPAEGGKPRDDFGAQFPYGFFPGQGGYFFPGQGGYPGGNPWQYQWNPTWACGAPWSFGGPRFYGSPWSHGQSFHPRSYSYWPYTQNYGAWPQSYGWPYAQSRFGWPQSFRWPQSFGWPQSYGWPAAFNYRGTPPWWGEYFPTGSGEFAVAA